MKMFLSFLGGAILLLILFGIVGLFAAIFSGILWMFANHLVMSVAIGSAIWLIASFIVRILIAQILDE